MWLSDNKNGKKKKKKPKRLYPLFSFDCDFVCLVQEWSVTVTVFVSAPMPHCSDSSVSTVRSFFLFVCNDETMAKMYDRDELWTNRYTINVSFATPYRFSTNVDHFWTRSTQVTPTNYILYNDLRCLLEYFDCVRLKKIKVHFMNIYE